MSVPDYDAIVVGAGQAGLAAAYHLQRAGLRFVVLDGADAVGGSWPRYYQSLQLLSPARYSSLPGRPFPGDPLRLPTRDEVIDYLRGYAEHFGFPVRLRTPVERVDSVRAGCRGFRVRSREGKTWRTSAVIAATGCFQQPHRPALPGMDAFAGRVLHASQYRRPQELAGQRVVVVGGGNSGVQIAVELAEVADVTLATRRPIKFIPRRVLGRPIHFWLRWTGIDRCPLLVGGPDPVYDCGRYRHALRAGRPPRRPMFTRLTDRGVRWAPGDEQPIDTLILATGYRTDYPYLHAIPDATRQRRGVGRVPGLYFVGCEGQRGPASATLRGVGADARHIVHHLTRRLRRTRQPNPARTTPPPKRAKGLEPSTFSLEEVENTAMAASERVLHYNSVGFCTTKLAPVSRSRRDSSP